MAEVLAKVSELLQKGEDLVLVRITSDRGSTPRAAGARMIVLQSGGIFGTIGGGPLEATAIIKAGQAFENACSISSAVDMDATDASGDDMVCGGRVEFICEYIHACEESAGIFEALMTGRRKFKRIVLCTELEDRDNVLKSARRFLLQDDVGDASSVSPALAERLGDMGSHPAGSAMLDIDGGKYLVDVVESGAELFIFGAGHVGAEVAALGARVGFRTVVLDDRAEFANAERLPGAGEVVALDSFEDGFSGLYVDRDSYVVIVTRGHAHDKTVLAQALSTKAGYIGMIGSKRKRDTIYKALLEEGFSEDDLNKVHCPVGLAIDTETPEEIAVSIIGELIHVRAQRRKCAREK